MSTEISIHSTLQHAHIASFLLAFEDFRHTYLVVEHAEGGDLRKHMPGRDEQRIRDFIVAPLLQALVHVHNKVSLVARGACTRFACAKGVQACKRHGPMFGRETVRVRTTLHTATECG